jgi:alkanesulfonate monooxygenase SsuD/methylene tetrahydromethanopterin reductase-like flavin-dependent oxidoreductase (luciferase family)
MDFGLTYNTGYLGTDPDQLIAVARHAEQCGFESFYLPEHIALYPGSAVASADLSEQKDQISAFATRLGLPGSTGPGSA